MILKKILLYTTLIFFQENLGSATMGLIYESHHMIISVILTWAQS